MEEQRPNPDELLAQVQAEEHKARRGRLKVFFGACAGVGKTYTMLEAARRQAADGVDVVVGYVEPHARPETMALLEGLEVAARPPASNTAGRSSRSSTWMPHWPASPR